MTDHSVIEVLSTLADTLNQAAATFEAIGRLPVVEALRMRGDRRSVPDIAPQSPMGVMMRQCERAAEITPQPSEPTTWKPEWPS